MNDSVKTGLAFGLTSGVITTLGLMVGLSYGTQSKVAVLGGILTIAVADSFSDALGIHISEESKKDQTTSGIWQSTIATFLSKLLFALTFMLPVLYLELYPALYLSIVWGLLVLSLLSFSIAKAKGEKPLYVIGEHLLIAVIVIFLTSVIGIEIRELFG